MKPKGKFCGKSYNVKVHSGKITNTRFESTAKMYFFNTFDIHCYMFWIDHSRIRFDQAYLNFERQFGKGNLQDLVSGNLGV